MENHKRFLLCFCVGILLLLIGDANAFNKIDPRRNPNLSPFEQWWSAYFCLQNYTNECPAKNKLGMSGSVSVGESDIREYCDNGCYNQTLIVMKCVETVHTHFKFESGASIAFLKNATATACKYSQALDTSYSKPNAATMAFTATFS